MRGHFTMQEIPPATANTHPNTEREKEVLSTMATRKCSVCGVEETPKAGNWLQRWFGCPNCNVQVCDSCAQKEREEAKKLRDMRDAPLFDPTSRVSAVCPSCTHELVRMGS